MHLRPVVAASLVALSVPVVALGDWPAKWTAGDTAAELAFAAVVAVDVGQTAWSLRHGYHEANPLLPRHPSSETLWAVGLAGGVAGHAIVSYLLPRGWRTGWQHASLVIEVGNSIRTMTVVGGLNLSF